MTGAQRQLKPKGTAEADGFAGCATAPRMGPLAAEERRPRTRVGSRTESGAGSVSGQLPQPRGNQPRITHFLPFLPCSKCHLSCHKAKGHLQTPPTGPSIRFLGPLTQQSLQPLSSPRGCPVSQPACPSPPCFLHNAWGSALKEAPKACSKTNHWPRLPGREAGHEHDTSSASPLPMGSGSGHPGLASPHYSEVVLRPKEETAKVAPGC